MSQDGAVRWLAQLPKKNDGVNVDSEKMWFKWSQAADCVEALLVIRRTFDRPLKSLNRSDTF